MKKLRTSLSSFLLLCLGIVIGGYLFNQSQPRSFLAVNQCERCTEGNDLMGLIGSVGMLKMSSLIPSVVLETDKSLVMIHPLVEKNIDYVIVPKKDIKDAADIAAEDMPYLIDAYLVAARLIKEKGIKNYRFFTNGPEQQDVTYLHFHLVDLGSSKKAPDGEALPPLPTQPAGRHLTEIAAN